MSKTHLKHRLTEKLRNMLWLKFIHVRNRGSWVICPYSSGLLRWDQGSHKIAPVPMKCPCRIWINHIDSPGTDSTTTAKYKLNIFRSSHPKECVKFHCWDTLVTDLQLTGDALGPISNWPMTYARPSRVTCVTRQKFAWVRHLQLIYDYAEWYTRPLSELWPTCKDFWPKEDLAAS